MSKIVCDICGTEYPESEDFCPNCGCSQDVSADMDMELEDDNFLEDSPITAVRKQKEAAAMEEAEQAAAESKETDSEPESELEEEDEEDRGSRGTGVAVLLTVLIMLLLGAAGFLFLRFMLPNMDLGRLPEQTQPGMHDQVPDAPTGPEIPCRMLALTSGGAVDLTREGEYKLIHVIVKPEDTTDTLVYTSSDESIVTVTEEGRLEAVAEGEAVITISCGSQTLQCYVTVGFVEETVPPTEAETQPAEEPQEESQEEPTEETASQEETEPVQTEAPEETVPETTGPQLKDVTLKLGKSEFILPPGYTYTVPLDCDLSYEEIEWSIEHTYIATVENGVVKGLTTGVTELTARYGDQTATCIVRIKKI